jgi:hypothetical protein
MTRVRAARRGEFRKTSGAIVLPAFCAHRGGSNHRDQSSTNILLESQGV